MSRLSMSPTRKRYKMLLPGSMKSALRSTSWLTMLAFSSQTNPGFTARGMANGIDTNLTSAFLVGREAARRQRTPARRWGVPEDLVGTAVYLASAASDYVNGQLIFVDGGLMAVL